MLGHLGGDAWATWSWLSGQAPSLCAACVGVLRNGAVQEEIRFLICPELIVCRLLAEAMDANEALHMHGFERFSRYTGYAQTFTFAGGYARDGSEGGGSDAQDRSALPSSATSRSGRMKRRLPRCSTRPSPSIRAP